MNRCKFCRLEVAQKVEAHIIPKAIFLDVKQDNEQLYEMGVRGNKKRRPIGVWDSSIWCLKCENKYTRIDTKGIEIIRCLQKEKCGTSLTKDVRTSGGNTSDLHDFALFVLWRASTASVPFYSSVQLGPIEERLRTALISDDVFSKNKFTMFVLSLNDPPDAIVQPIRMRIEGVNFIKIYLNRINILLKVDSRETPRVLSEIQVARDSDSFLLPFHHQAAGVTDMLARVAKNRFGGAAKNSFKPKSLRSSA